MAAAVLVQTAVCVAQQHPTTASTSSPFLPPNDPPVAKVHPLGLCRASMIANYAIQSSLPSLHLSTTPASTAGVNLGPKVRVSRSALAAAHACLQDVPTATSQSLCTCQSSTQNLYGANKLPPINRPGGRLRRRQLHIPTLQYSVRPICLV